MLFRSMLWALDSDSFTYKYQPVPAKKITRRSVLANVASVYDPMGLISPLILPARVKGSVKETYYYS